MKPRHGVNGSGRFNVHSVDMGGWVRVYAEPRDHDDAGPFLSAALTDWFRNRPQLRMRCVVPVTRDGNTTELHAWFDAHVFPPTDFAPAPSPTAPN